jgi:hypothetical protein
MRIVKIANFNDASNEKMTHSFPSSYNTFTRSHTFIKIVPADNAYKYYIVRVYNDNTVWGIRGRLIGAGREPTVYYEPKGAWSSPTMSNTKAASVERELMNNGYIEADAVSHTRIPWDRINAGQMAPISSTSSKPAESIKKEVKPVEPVSPQIIEQVPEDEMEDYIDLLGSENSWYKTSSRNILRVVVAEGIALTLDQAKDPKTDPKLLSDFLMQAVKTPPDFGVKDVISVLVALNPSTPAKVIDEAILLVDPNWNLAIALASSYKVNAKVLENLWRDNPNTKSARKALENPNFPSALLAKIVMNEDILESVALDNTEEYNQILAAVKNPFIDPKALQFLWHNFVEKNRKIRGLFPRETRLLLEAASNPNMPRYILKEILEGNSRDAVYNHAVANPNSPPEILASLSQSTDEEIANIARRNPSNPNADPDYLMQVIKGFRDKRGDISYTLYAALNPKVPAPFLANILREKTVDPISLAIMKNKKVPINIKSEWLMATQSTEDIKTKFPEYYYVSLGRQIKDEVKWNLLEEYLKEIRKMQGTNWTDKKTTEEIIHMGLNSKYRDVIFKNLPKDFFNSIALPAQDRKIIEEYFVKTTTPEEKEEEEDIRSLLGKNKDVIKIAEKDWYENVSKKAKENIEGFFSFNIANKETERKIYSIRWKGAGNCLGIIWHDLPKDLFHSYYEEIIKMAQSEAKKIMKECK